MTEPTPLDLPVGLRWVKLVCRLGRLVTDSAADEDAYPDLLPVGGTLTLAASPSRVRIQEADGRWRSVEVAGRTYTIRGDGELVDAEGRVGVWIPDPTSLLVEPQGYAITATITPTGGTFWSVTIGGSTVLPDVVDLVAVSSVGSVSPSVTASFDARLNALETGGGGGVDVSDATTTTKGILRLAGDLGGTADAPTVPGLAGKADADHGHAIGDVTGLQSALDGKQAAGSYAAASHDHDGTYAPVLGPDDNYVTDAEKAALHSHANMTALDAVSGVNTGDQDLSDYATTASLATVATSGAYADLTGTPTIPDSPDDIGAAPAMHDHTAADIDSGAATDGHVLTADGAGGAAWEAPPAGGGGTMAVTYVGDGKYQIGGSAA